MSILGAMPTWAPPVAAIALLAVLMPAASAARTLPPPTMTVKSGSFPIGDNGEVVNVLEENAMQFSDRTYKMTNVPDQLTGLGYFTGPCHTGAEIDLTTTGKQDIYVIVSNGDGLSDQFYADMKDGGFTHVTEEIDGIDAMHTTSFGGAKGFQAWHAVVDGTIALDFRNGDELTIVYSLELKDHCAAGKYVADDSVSPFTCNDCPTGQYQDESTDETKACKPWATCGPGEKFRDGDAIFGGACFKCDTDPAMILADSTLPPPGSGLTLKAELGSWKHGFNLNPSDGHNMGFAAGWGETNDIGTSSARFAEDFIDQSVWGAATANYIAIVRHENGKCEASKVWQFAVAGRTLLSYFTLPDYLGDTNKRNVATTGGHLKLQVTKSITSADNDPIFGTDGDLALNWNTGNSGVRISLTGGHLSDADWTPHTGVSASNEIRFIKAFDNGECTGDEICMFEGNGDNPGTDAEQVAACSSACLLGQQAPASGSWAGFEAKGFIVSHTMSGRCWCESQPSDTCNKYTNTDYTRYDWQKAAPKYDAHGLGNDLACWTGEEKLPAQFIRIDGLIQSGDVKIINLSEVEAFDSDGNLIAVSLAAMSSGDPSECVDGILLFEESGVRGSAAANMCHSNVNDGDPWLRISYENQRAVAKIVVHNRRSPTRTRIVGATISISTDEAGADALWTSTFSAAEDLDTFTFDTSGGGGCATGSSGDHSAKWWHDASPLQDDCDGGSCQVLGTDHGSDLDGVNDYGQYAIFASETLEDFPCSASNPRSIELVAAKTECGGEEKNVGQLASVEDCEDKCRGTSSFFIFGNKGHRCNEETGECTCYCEVPNTPNDCAHSGHPGYNLYHAVLKAKLGACEGDCDHDSDCKTGLECFQRDLSQQVVPGCVAGGKGDHPTHDYCYLRPKAVQAEVDAYAPPALTIVSGAFATDLTGSQTGAGAASPHLAGVHVLGEGSVQFSDRSYIITNVPAQLKGLGYFQGPCHTRAQLELRTSGVQDIYVVNSNAQSDKTLFYADLKKAGFTDVTREIDGVDAMHTTSFGSSKGFQVWHAVVDGLVEVDVRNGDEITILYSPLSPVETTTTAAAVIDDAVCDIKRDMQYSPIDNIPGQVRTVAWNDVDGRASDQVCARRCNDVDGCAYWSMWADGGCHLSSSASVATPANGVVSGSRFTSRCNEETGEVIDDVVLGTYQLQQEHHEETCVSQPRCSGTEHLADYDIQTKGVCTSWDLCNAGQFLSGAANHIGGECLDCKAGTFQQLDNHFDATCTTQPECNDGWYLAELSIVKNGCAEKSTTCGPGTRFSPGQDTEKGKDDTVCHECGELEFKTGTNNLQACAEKRSECSAGNYFVAGSATVRETDDAECIPCPAGTFKAGLNSLTECAKKLDTCPPGQLLDMGIDATDRDDRTCVICPAGGFKTDHGAGNCTAKRTECADGFELNPGINRITYLDDSSCEACKPGTFKTGTNANQCGDIEKKFCNYIEDPSVCEDIDPLECFGALSEGLKTQCPALCSACIPVTCKDGSSDHEVCGEMYVAADCADATRGDLVKDACPIMCQTCETTAASASTGGDGGEGGGTSNLISIILGVLLLVVVLMVAKNYFKSDATTPSKIVSFENPMYESKGKAVGFDDVEDGGLYDQPEEVTGGGADGEHDDDGLYQDTFDPLSQPAEEGLYDDAAVVGAPEGGDLGYMDVGAGATPFDEDLYGEN